MKSGFLFWLLALVLTFAINYAGATTYNWTGLVNDDWSNTGNWSGGTNYPGYTAADIAIFPNTTGINTVRLTGNITLTNVTVNAITNGVTTINTNGYTLTITGTTGGLTLGSNSANLTLLGSGAVTINSITFSGTGDYLRCGSTTDNSTNVTFNSGAAIILPNNAGNGIFNYGRLFLTSSTITFGSSSQLYNYSTGTITATSCIFNFSKANSTIKNYGIFTVVTGGQFTLSQNPTTITNYSGGTFTAPNCNFTLSNTGAQIANYGSFTASSASVFALSGATSDVMNFAGGVFTDNGSTYTLTGANAANQINNQGTFTAILSTIKLNSGLCNITNTGIFNGDDLTVTTGYNNSYINNSGTFTADSGSSINFTKSYCYILNSGTFYAGTSNSACTITISGGSYSYIDNKGSAAKTAYFYLGSTSSINLPSSGGDDDAGSGNYVDNDPNYSVFTIQSDRYGSGAIGPIGSSNIGFTGVFNVERYFQGNSTYDNVKSRWLGRNYRIISSPVNTGTTVNGNYVSGLNYIAGLTAGQTTGANSLTNAFVTGCAGGSTSSGNPSLYLYREDKVPSNTSFTSGNFIGITDITNSTSAGTITASDAGSYSMPVGTGVFFFFRGNATNWSTRTVSPYIQPENVTLTSTGHINQWTYTFKNWYTTGSSNLGYTGTGTGTNAAVRGFNMVGNPYACSINWNTAYSGSTGIVRTYIYPTIWVFNPVTNQYDSYTTTSGSTGTSNGGGTDGSGYATNIIASGQGFFVKASAANPKLVIDESAKSVGSLPVGSNLLMSRTSLQAVVPQLLRLKLFIDTFNYDDIAIGFNAAASEMYDGNEDAEYLKGINAPEGLASFSADGIPLSINFLPLPKAKPLEIRLDVQGTLTRTYTLKRTQLSAVPEIFEFWLMDKYKKDSLDLRHNTSYIFDLNVKDTATYGANRFSVVIRQNPALGLHLLNFTAIKVKDGVQIAWQTENEQNYTNFTVERSADGGVTFTELGGFASAALGSYGYLDIAPARTANSYRLKLVDLNGAISYSKVITLTRGNQTTTYAANNINVYPNPASSTINLAISQPENGYSASSPTLKNIAVSSKITLSPAFAAPVFSIKIINIYGVVIKTAMSSSATWQGDIVNLLPGTYIITVTNNNDKTLVGRSAFVKL